MSEYKANKLSLLRSAYGVDTTGLDGREWVIDVPDGYILSLHHDCFDDPVFPKSYDCTRDVILWGVSPDNKGLKRRIELLDEVRGGKKVECRFIMVEREIIGVKERMTGKVDAFPDWRLRILVPDSSSNPAPGGFRATVFRPPG